MMITDGEVFYHRTERPGRSVARVQSRPRVEEPTSEIGGGAPSTTRIQPRAERVEPLEQRVQLPEQPGRDRLLRLEHLAQQLDRRLVELDGALKSLAARYIGLHDTPAAPLPAARAAMPAAAARTAEGAATSPESSVKVALFADGTARAILGHVRIEHQEETEPTT